MRNVSQEFGDRQLPWFDAALEVLKGTKEPLDCDQIVEGILEKNLRFNLGPYPQNAVASALSTSIFYHGDTSPVRRVSGFKFTLSKDTADHRTRPHEIKGSESECVKPELFEACGLNWMRNKVLWGPTPSLQGRDSLENIKDFSNYSGIYALYDGHDLVFAGWADTGNLGEALYLHTSDFLAARWDAFSWFGISHLVSDQRQILMPSDWQRSLVKEIASVFIKLASPCFNKRIKESLPDEVFWEQQEDPSLGADESERQARDDRRKELDKELEKIPTLELDNWDEDNFVSESDHQTEGNSYDDTPDLNGSSIDDDEISEDYVLETNHPPCQQVVNEGSVVSYLRMDQETKHTIRLGHVVNSSMQAVDERNAMSRADVGSPLFRALIHRQVGEECEVDIREKGQLRNTFMVKILAITSFMDYLGSSLRS